MFPECVTIAVGCIRNFVSWEISLRACYKDFTMCGETITVWKITVQGAYHSIRSMSKDLINYMEIIHLKFHKELELPVH